MHLEKAGGVAAIIAALAYVLGFAAMATVLNPGDVSGWSQTEKLAYVLQRKSLFQLCNIGIYVVFGIALVLLAVALHERLKAKAHSLMQVATAFGLIWAGLVIASGMLASVGLEAVARLYLRDPAQAALAWLVIGTVQDALGGGMEVLGGLWLLAVSVAGLRRQQLPTPLNWLGILIGLTGVLTIAPPLGELAAVFGLGQIVWFAWIGVQLLLRGERHEIG